MTTEVVIRSVSVVLFFNLADALVAVLAVALEALAAGLLSVLLDLQEHAFIREIFHAEYNWAIVRNPNI